MPTTWIEIIDTSIKIGLGALLTGTSAYLISRQNHNKSIEKEYIAKQREILESVSLDIEEITHVLLKYWSFITDWTRNKENGIENTKEKSNTVTELRSELFGLFKGLTNSEGRLLLIGCKSQQTQLREYGSKISAFYRYASRNNEEVESSKLEEWRTTLLDSRLELYTSLNDAYKNIKI